MFDNSPFSLGIAGGYSSPAAHHEFDKADLVVAVGASLTSFTTEGGALFRNAYVIQIDDNPVGLKDGHPAANLYVKADAKTAVQAISTELQKTGRRDGTLRTKDVASRIKDLSVDRRSFPIEKGTLDPRKVIDELDGVIPKEWDIVSGSGHCSYFHSQLKGRLPTAFHSIREFSAIGNGLSLAMGVAAARGNGNVVLMEGDGGFLMHIQELETLQRHGIKMLICVFNDGGYGAEFHTLRGEGVNTSNAEFGRPDFASIARGFGLRGATVFEDGMVETLFNEYAGQAIAEVWDLRISDRVTSPQVEALARRGIG
jgi:thiamine pyrophosphate-dependent acetolactate synthase large subunit-like protein